MTKKNFFDQISQSSQGIQAGLLAVVVVWSMVFLVIIAGVIFLLERPSQAQQLKLGTGTPYIVLDPTSGLPGSNVLVQGEGWTPGDRISIYLLAPGQTELPGFALAGGTADAQGQFSVTIVIPSHDGWQNPGAATVYTRSDQSGVATQSAFYVLALPDEGTTPPPVSTPQPQIATAVANVNLNIHSGPGTAYPVLGVLLAGQSAEITGISPDGAWWQIRFAGVANEQGWVSAAFVAVQNTQNVPVVQEPPPPPTPTPSPAVTGQWLGEYFDNPNLSGTPAQVRRDAAIDFDWGSGSPGPGVPGEGFSVLWTRQVNFQNGTYLFQVQVSGRVRLWVDNNSVINSWQVGGPRPIEAQVYINAGRHQVTVEYVKYTGLGLIQVNWQPVTQPSGGSPAAVIMGPRRGLMGQLLTFDGGRSSGQDGDIVSYAWNFGDGATASVALVTHVYSQPGAYQVSLTVTNSQGLTATTTQVVRIAAGR
jgi:uncharacterized protein YraI